MSLLTHTARVVYDASRVQVEALADALEVIGFDAEAKTATAQQERSSTFAVRLEEKVRLEDLESVLKAIIGVERLETIRGQHRVFYFPAIVGARAILEALKGVAQHDLAPLPPTRDPSAPKRRRLLICFPAALAVLLLSMTPHDLSTELATFCALLLTAIVLYFGGWSFHRQAVTALRHGAFTMDVLVSSATNILFVYAAGSLLEAEVRGKMYNKQFLHFFEAVAVLVEVLLLGRCIEERARQNTTIALRELTQARPPHAILISARASADSHNDVGEEGESPIHNDLLELGDTVRLKPGEPVPADGVLRSDGELFVDESLLTGEADPVLKCQGAELIGGSTVVTGGGVMEVTALGNSTVLAEIISLVEGAQLSPPRIQRIADRVAGWFVPAVFMTAALTFGIWIAVALSSQDSDDVDFAFALNRSMAVLMIACPCALGLATPTAVMVATSVAARRLGCLIKSTETFESLFRVGTVVLDKTGTITAGRPAVVDSEGFRDARLWAYVAALETTSEHPLAKALVVAAEARAQRVPEVSGWRCVAGSGVEGLVEGIMMRVGNEEWCCAGADLRSWALNHQREGCAVVYVARGGSGIAAVALRDEVQQGSPSAIGYFQRHGMRVWMCTGDSEVTAKTIAAAVGIDKSCVVARCGPARKAEFVQELMKDSGASQTVLMVGDGINDAPSLAMADIGVAIGCGSRLTCEAADVVLTRSALEDLQCLHSLSRSTVFTIYRNFFWAFVFNAVGIPFAAGALYPAFGVFIPPLFAGLAMACSSITVISSSLFLLVIFRHRKFGVELHPQQYGKAPDFATDAGV